MSWQIQEDQYKLWHIMVIILTVDEMKENFNFPPYITNLNRSIYEKTNNNMQPQPLFILNSHL